MGSPVPTPGRSPQQLLSFSASLVLLLGVAAGAMWYLNGTKTAQQQQQTTPPQQQQVAGLPPVGAAGVPGPASVASGPVAKGMDGRWAVTYGGLGLRVDPKDCGIGRVWFDDVTESTMNGWNLETVPGFEDAYYIRSEERAFDKACDKAYLTAPSSCTGPIVMDRPGNTDRQVWKLYPSRDGGYEIQSVACFNKRWPSYMISGGKVGGVSNTARLAARDGSSYVLRRSQA